MSDDDLIPGENARYSGGTLHKMKKVTDAPERPSARDVENDALRRLRGEDAPEEQYDDDDRPGHLKGERDAHQHLEERRQEAAEEREQSEALDRENRELEVDRDIQRTRSWTQEDHQIINQLGAKKQQFDADMAVFGQALAQARANPESVTPLLAERLQQAQARLQAEHAELMQAAHVVQKTAGAKSLQAEQKSLHKAFPELAKKEVRNDFIKWASDKGIPPEVARNVRDPSVIGRAFRQFQQEQGDKKKAWLDRPREAVVQSGMFSPAGRTPSQLSVSEARQRLAKSGSMDEALNYMTLMRERAKEAQNG